MSRSAKPPAKRARASRPRAKPPLALTRIALPRAALRVIEGAAQAAWPRECCGLLVGLRQGAAVEITRANPSPNRAADPRVAFEIDPELWLRLTRTLEDGPESVVGLYHSHPDGPPAPSARDLAAAWGPDLIWIVTSVARGQPPRSAAFRLVEADGKRQFVPIALGVT